MQTLLDKISQNKYMCVCLCEDDSILVVYRSFYVKGKASGNINCKVDHLCRWCDNGI